MEQPRCAESVRSSWLEVGEHLMAALLDFQFGF